MSAYRIDNGFIVLRQKFETRMLVYIICFNLSDVVTAPPNKIQAFFFIRTPNCSSAELIFVKLL